MGLIDTCDHCRARKVRCIFPTTTTSEAGPSTPTSRGPCQNCERREEECTFEYRYKKPGRPRGSTTKRETSSVTRSRSPRARPDSEIHNDEPYGPSFGSIFGSARAAAPPSYIPPHPQEQTQTINPASLTTTSATPAWVFPPPDTTAAAGTTSASATHAGVTEPILSHDPHIPFPQISAFASWETIGYFLSLHMLHQHVLTPLVHQPSFARDLLHRRDVQDEPFRGLLLSIVAYTICQVPIHMLLDQMDRPQLESLCRQCQRASRAIQVRQQMTPNMVTLTSTIFDWITSQAIGQDPLRQLLMSDVRGLIYSLELHQAAPSSMSTSVEIEVARRLYWEAYAIDKTNALNGHTIALPDYEGIPPFPLEVDDEYITHESIHPQPSTRQSFMSGFIVISRIFQILSQTLMRQRTLRINPSAGPDRTALLFWIEETTSQLRGIMDSLPPKLRHDYVVPPAGAGVDHSLYATQQANIQITALCLELSLLDLKAVVTEGEGVVIDRKSIAEKAFKQLSIIPIDSIASNGESMRGKVLRVILALLSEDNSEEFSTELWDWWNMYSRVQFLQVIPDNTANAAPP